MRLCDIIDIKSAFMEKTDLSEEEIQTIIDDIPTAFDGDKVVEQLNEKDSDCEDFGKTVFLTKSEAKAKLGN